MKRRLFSVLSIIFICVTVFSLSACKKDPNGGLDADSVWAEINGSMDKLTSYVVTTKLEGKYFVNGIEAVIGLDGRSVYVGVGTENFYYSSDVSMHSKAESVGYSTETAFKNLYVGGRFFVESEDDYHHQKIYCEMTPEEAEEYLYDESEVKYNDATSRKVKKNEDGSFTLVFSGYKSEDVVLMQKMFGVNGVLEKDSVLDVKVTAEAGADYLAKKIKVEFILADNADSDEKPSIVATTVYSDHNTATKGAEAPDIKKYEEVPDLQLLKDLNEMFEEIENSKRGKFELNIKQTLKVGDKSMYTTEEDAVSYGYNDKGYYYNIYSIVNKGTANMQTCDIKYSDGKQTVEVNGGTSQEVEQTSEEAVKYINSLIRNCDYNMMYVTGMTKVDDNTYKIESNRSDTKDSQAFFAQIGAKLNYESSTITVRLKDGHIDRIEVSRSAKGSISDQNNAVTYVTLNINAEIRYNGITFIEQ